LYRSAETTPQAYYHSGVYRSKDTGATWEHIYYYAQSNFSQTMKANANVSGGWVDWDIGWGSRGPARVLDPTAPDNRGGFAVCESNPDIAMFTNKMMIYVTTKGRAATAADRSVWVQKYAKQEPELDPVTGNPVLVDLPSGQRWSSIELGVTTTWNYHVHPIDPNRHYICYTDVGLARSEDDGKSWCYSPPKQRRPKSNGAMKPPKSYNTIYQLAFDPADPKRIWAAASDQHNIPYKNWLRLRYGGGVARSDDYGATWQDASGNLPYTNFDDAPPPVVSILLDPNSQPKRGRLWASVFGYGVYYSDNDGGTWVDRSSGLPTTNRNTYRLHLHDDGTLFCAITATRNPHPNDPTNPNRASTYTGETGLWRLAAVSPGPPRPALSGSGSPRLLPRIPARPTPTTRGGGSSTTPFIPPTPTRFTCAPRTWMQAIQERAAHKT
jgi:hypothetical protein